MHVHDSTKLSPSPNTNIRGERKWMENASDASEIFVPCKDLNRFTHIIMHNNSSIRFLEEQETIQENSTCFRFPVFQVDNIPQNLIVLNCAINVLFLITAILGNLLVISAVWKTPSLRCPSNVFLCGLSTSDLTVGLVVQPLFLYIELIQILERPTQYPCALGHAFIIVSHSVCGVSLLTVTAISVDRLLALHYHLRYVNIVTVQRVSYLILFFWLVSTSLASLILWNEKIFLVVMALVVGICLCLSVLVHLKIYRVVRRHQQQIQTQREAVQARDDFNVARFKRTAANAFLIHYFLLLCYTPLFITLLLTSNEDKIDSASWKKADSAIAWKLTSTIVFMNSAVNPFIYCWRLRGMRITITKTLKAIIRRS
ncbi:melanocyte-stimulating hormone receptor-like [Orbicella faveolata]|uniref:melanocyte-stimulating hormone receptor-like n=1 Tax=Orbicella faveolata TaxID=48498 RepID=UPI0009E3E43D|nr:melanocyte-stimulating hormone receptor-like [Orbicella faveolata]